MRRKIAETDSSEGTEVREDGEKLGQHEVTKTKIML